ncbi:hypothetical protein VI08_02610 [Luteibacter yeojuensis]|uniref:Uncharacterized protein n=1 Tax=Luteibacter yeojuensis TaxID=345309 RepID=A0A0F3L120_9GAMM|nr:hypothetical protein VI08_02610 [Luteibacter yeojuensis]
MRSTRMSPERRRFWRLMIIVPLGIAFHTWVLSMCAQFDGMTKDVVFYLLLGAIPCASSFAVLHLTLQYERKSATQSGCN